MVQRDPGPFEYYQEIHPVVNGDTIRADAHDPGLNAATIGALAGELEGDAKTVAGNMSGDITAAVQLNPQGASATAKNLAAKGNYAVGLICSFAGMVDTFDTAVNHCNWRYRTELAMAMRWAGEAAASTPDKSDDAQVTEAKMGPQAKANIQPDYQAAVGKLDDDADSIAVKFKQGPTDANVKDLIDAGLIPLTAAAFYPTLILTDDDRASYYRSTMKDMTAPQRAQYILAHKEISGPVLDKLLKDDTATSNEIGKLVAAKTNDLGDDATHEQVDEVTALINRFAGSHEASAGIIHELGGAGLVNAFNLAGYRAISRGSFADGGADGPANENMMTALRDLFRSGEPTLAEHDPEASRTVARDMMGVIRNLTSPDGDPAERSSDLANSVFAVSTFLKDSDLSTPFLDTMGDELDDFERNVMGPNHTTWRQMSMGGFGAGALLGDSESSFDPVSSYMSALGHNDEASLQFFTGGGENEHDADGGDRQEYYIKDRLWGHDNFDGVMSALDSATTGADNLGNPTSAHESAELMSNTVDLIAQRQGVDFGTDGEKFDPGDVSEAGTQHVAHMLSTYMASVDNALEVGADRPPGVQVLTDARFGGASDMPIFSGSALRNMVDVAVSTDGGFNDMRHGLSLYQNVQLQNSITDHGSVDNATSNADARLEGFFVNSVGDTKIADAADQDARVQSWIDMGKDVVGEIPIPGGKVVEFLASHAIDAGASELSDHYASNEDSTVDSENDYATAALNARHEAIQQALVTGGAITPDEVASELTSGYPKSQVEAWFPNGQFPSQDQYNAMSTDDQTNMRNALNSIIDERHLQDVTNYDQSYKDMFSDYFEKGDGDGN